MAKWFGNIGFEDVIETPEGSGIHKPQIVVKQYQGDLIRNYKRFDSGDKVNDDLNISNEFSIIADLYAYENFHKMRYIEYMGAKWKITGVDAAQRPRLVLTVGGVYNGENGPSTRS